jgi:excisionase family DNA binding protein
MRRRNSARQSNDFSAFRQWRPKMDPSPKILYTRAEAAATLSLSISSIDLLVGRGMLRAIRKGRRVLIHRSELERVARQNIPAIWPAKLHGKTVRSTAA